MTKRSETEAHAPLSPAVFQILLALADEDRHGYAISREIESRTDGRTRLGPATLYSNLKRMLTDGLIVENLRRPSRSKDDPRRRYYRLTPRGRAAAEAEVRRLERMIHDARAIGLAPREG